MCSFLIIECSGGRNEKEYKNKRIYFLIFIFLRMSHGKFEGAVKFAVQIFQAPPNFTGGVRPCGEANLVYKKGDNIYESSNSKKQL